MTDIKTKPFVKGYKYRIYPTDSQIELLNKTFGCCRYVWNRALAEAKQDYEEYLILKNSDSTLKSPNYTGYNFVNKLIQFKHDPKCGWLYDVNSVSLQQTMLILGKAFSTFFKNRKGYPKFKKKTNHQSFSLMNNSFRFKDNNFYIAKSDLPLIIGWSRNGKIREIPNLPTSAVISKSPTGKYYISFTCEYTPVKSSGQGKIGIDLGLKDFIVSSDGTRVPNPKYFKKHEKNLKRKQQKISKCCKNSKNRLKAKQKVALIHERISNCRNNFQHQLSRKLINENQVIGLENLLVKNMVRNRKLSKAVSQAAWSSFIYKLIYKSRESQHCNIIKIDTYFPSSHLCNETNLKLDRKLKLSEREWNCPHCGNIHDRDINAAKNIRNESILVQEKHKVSPNGLFILAKNSYSFS